MLFVIVQGHISETGRFAFESFESRTSSLVAHSFREIEVEGKHDARAVPSDLPTFC